MPGPDYVARLLLLGLILVVNSFFAASEVALLSVRDSRLRHLADEGNAGAKTALALLANPEKLLSVTQIGVTLASLGLGWAGEDTLYALLIGLFHPVVTPATSTLLHTACFIAAFAAMTYCHVVLGEVVPKNLAIDKADRLAVIVAPVLMLFYRIAAPFVSVIEASAAGLTRILGAKAPHRGGGHSAEELKLIVSSSRFAGHLPGSLENMIHRVLDVNDLSVREIMRPRREMIAVPLSATLDQVLITMITSSHSRLPVWRDRPEQIVGVISFRDMLRLWHNRRAATRAGRSAPRFQVEQIMRKPLFVPETRPLLQMLEEFRRKGSHLGVVVDEFGTVTGLLSVEDVLEQIVGEIEDEVQEILPAGEPETADLDIDGTTTIRDFASNYGVELPVNAGFQTVAGYMLLELGHIPQAGESVVFDGRKFTVAAMERNRIAKIHVEKIDGRTGTEPESNSDSPRRADTEERERKIAGH